MVHALSEIYRVLVPDGILIDLRPVSDHWRVEVVSAREIREIGHVTDLPLGLEDDNAANQAMTNVELNGWFKRESEEFFPIHYLWDTASEMEKWIDEEWENFIGLDEETKRTARSAWALGDGDSRVRVRVKMLLTSWRKHIGQ
jgi:hypothetical protein